MSVVIIDNYDSFTYNLRHLLREAGADVTVVRNDCFALEELERFDKIVLSPGPGVPSEAGLLTDVIRRYAGVKPILGVCLGHQAIGEVFGGRLVNISEVCHGVATPCDNLGNEPMFSGCGDRFEVGRYHSWVVDRYSLPACLEATALSDDGFIMAMKHREYDVRGIQFHPESVMTPCGRQMLENWLAM
ncbi:anthranilate synthase component II [Xylanibacter caecicola]|uniref:anthranilate synthase component II n=1 Tax=Xylanibacter caecicola TaxID=2736294 RepID=UPI002582E30C|nr:aminodeoxychorismate/anthranilate synthase component II [Xylanibacter caecicola]